MVLRGSLVRPALVLPALLGLAACQSSSRLGSILPDDPYRSARANAPAPAPLTPAPSGDVESTELPPPGGAAPPLAGAFPAGGAPGSGVATAPGVPTYPAPTPTPGLPAPRVATAPVPASPAPAPSRTALIGNWSVSEAAGGKCRITLSSAPKLDLYGAGTTGCQNKELQRVNAWELAGSEVILYEPGGGVVARLRQAGGGYSGATAKSGAPVSIEK